MKEKGEGQEEDLETGGCREIGTLYESRWRPSSETDARKCENT